MKLGALGAGSRLCDSSAPFDVFTSNRSPAAVTEHALICRGRDAQLLDHVEEPHDVGLVAMGVGLGVYGPSFLPSAKPSVSRHTTSQRLVTTHSRFPFDQRRAADALVGIVQGSTGGELFAGKLPEESAVALAEAEQQPRSTWGG